MLSPSVFPLADSGTGSQPVHHPKFRAMQLPAAPPALPRARRTQLSSQPAFAKPCSHLLPCRGASTWSSLGTPCPVPLSCPPLPSQAGNGAVPSQAVGETERESSTLPNQGGKVCCRFCLFSLFIPWFIFTPGCSRGRLIYWAATLDFKAGSCLEVQPRYSTGSPSSPILSRSSVEKPTRFQTWPRCAGVPLGELVAWLGRSSLGLGKAKERRRVR